MTISSRTRHVTAIAAAALAIGLGGLAAAAPAHAQSAAPAGSDTTATAEISFGPDVNPITCPTSQITVATGALAIAVPAGCFAMNQGGYETVWFSKLGITYMTEKLTLQTDGNFVFYNSDGQKWGAATRAADNPNGPGYTVHFQTDGNLVVRNIAGTAIWASNTHTYPNAILAFQDDGNLVIYPSKTDFTALWATHTR